MFGITIQMFGHSSGSHYTIDFNGDQMVPLVMGDMCIAQPWSA